MAAITSTQSGNASVDSTWVGGTPPSDGDTITIATGHTVTQDVNRIYGSNGSGVGHGITINATSSSVYGELVIPSGVTLTLRGFDVTNNTLALVNQHAKFTGQSGSAVLGDTTGDYVSIILNKGHVSLNGVSLSVPAANIDWNTSVASEAVANISLPFDYTNTVRVSGLANPWISNAAGTGLGSLGDSSLSISSQSTAGTLTTEVALGAWNSPTLNVTSSGKYAVDYDRGIIYFFSTSSSNTFTAAYKRLNLTKTWGIESTQNTAGNSFISIGSTFQYMGPITGSSTKNAVYATNKMSAAANSGNTDRLFSFTGNMVRYCSGFIGLKSCTGTLADPIPVTGNTIYHVRTASTFGAFFNQQSATNDYLNLSSNTLSIRSVFVRVNATASGTIPMTSTNLKIDSNIGSCGGLFTGPSLAAVYPSGSVSNNNTVGIAGLDDLRWVVGFGGTQANPATIASNSIGHANRLGNYTAHSVIEKNICYRTYHHGWIAPTEDDLQVTNIIIRNNLYFGNFADSLSASPYCESGYNHRHWIDDLRVVCNTIVNHPQGVFGFGDIQDNAGNSLSTKIVVTDNLVYNATSGGTAGGQAVIQRSTDTTARVTRIHCIRLDYNLGYNVTAFYENIQALNGGTFLLSTTNYADPGTVKNVTGVALQFPSYTTSQTGITLAYTYTSAISRTLTLTDSGGAGSPVSIVFGTGTLTSNAAHTTQGASSFRSGATITDSGQAWNTNSNNAACPKARWLLMTSGTQSGEVRAITNNSATVLTVVPAFTTLALSGDTFAILEAEVTLTAGSGATVNVGIDARLLTSSTKSDSSISYSRNDVTTDPLLVNPLGTTAIDFKIGSSSPAKNSGIVVTSVTTDYFGTSRPQGSSNDLGFHELSGIPRQSMHQARLRRNR